MQSGLNSDSTAVGVMEKVLYSSSLRFGPSLADSSVYHFAAAA
jgi:hypothetical protein